MSALASSSWSTIESLASSNPIILPPSTSSDSPKSTMLQSKLLVFFFKLKEAAKVLECILTKEQCIG